MTGEQRRFLLLVELHGDTTFDRIAEAGKSIRVELNKMTGGDEKEWEIIFSSTDHDLFGYFVRTTWDANRIERAVDGCTGTRREDSILVIELGSTFSGKRFGRAATWLQHH